MSLFWMVTFLHSNGPSALFDQSLQASTTGFPDIHVHTRPASVQVSVVRSVRVRRLPWVIRMDIFDQLVRIGSTEFNVGSAALIDICSIPIPIDLAVNYVVVRTIECEYTWTFRSFTPDRFESVALTAVLTLKPSTTKSARFSSVG
jgi:hypothetical protein